MWRWVLILMISVKLNAQHFIQNPNTQSVTTSAVKEWCQNNFPEPPRRQPKIYIEFTPLLPNLIGITRRLQDGSFLIDLNPLYDTHQLERTLIHELVHVNQMWNGDLEKKRGQFYWKGQPYPFNHPYRERPWEVDARRRTILWCDGVPVGE